MSNENKVLKIDVIRTKNRNTVYVSGNQYNRYSFYNAKNEKLELTPTHQSGWFDLPDGEDFADLRQSKSKPIIRKYFRLKNMSLESPKIPAEIEYDNVDFDDEEFSDSWGGKYEGMEGLYDLCHEYGESEDESIPFERNVIAELPSYDPMKANDFSYPTTKVIRSSLSWGNQKTIPVNITYENVIHSFTDKLWVHPQLLVVKSCKLTDEDLLKIIAKHVTDNINRNRATFLYYDNLTKLEISKLIDYIDPIEYKVNVNVGTGRRDKYETRYRTSRSVKIFECDLRTKSRGDLPDIIGTDLRDLKNKIDEYLKTLIEDLNTPLKDCPKCNGCGTIS